MAPPLTRAPQARLESVKSAHQNAQILADRLATLEVVVVRVRCLWFAALLNTAVQIKDHRVPSTDLHLAGLLKKLSDTLEASLSELHRAVDEYAEAGAVRRAVSAKSNAERFSELDTRITRTVSDMAALLALQAPDQRRMEFVEDRLDRVDERITNIETTTDKRITNIETIMLQRMQTFTKKLVGTLESY